MKTSVRFRLLLMALLPLTLLMPLLLLLGFSRWTAEYDKLLISKVESDLRVAEQYLSRIMVSTGKDLSSVADAEDFAHVLTQPLSARLSYLERKRVELGMDFLYFQPAQKDADDVHWPVIKSAIQGNPSTAIDIFTPEDLRRIDLGLAKRASIDLIATEAAVPTSRTTEGRGMIVHSASPVTLEHQKGVVVGGILLNRNLSFIDTINDLVYLNAVTGGSGQGTATLFLEDVRVSTNVRLFEDIRALGTRVSADVRHTVLEKGTTWLAPAFVVNDWYVSGYLPIRDSFDARVGMLYVGFLEEPFTAAKRDAILWMLAAFIGVLFISVPLFLSLAKSIFSPLEAMTKIMQRVESGDLSARNGNLAAVGEIGQVAAHLDSLLEQVQDRDKELRDWADQLNNRVDRRTSELRDANTKLEKATQQLVMSEKLAAIGEITAGVAHEINNPIAVIQGNVDVMRDTLGPSTETVQAELTLIDRQVTRITAIVGKLLQFARPSDFSGDKSSLSLETVLSDCLLLVAHELNVKNIQVQTQIGQTSDIHIDRGELQQVIVNLIINAAQAVPIDGIVTLTVENHDYEGQSGACLIVRDNGPGIPADLIGKVFDPFFTTKRGVGTGLGLSISQTIIQRAGGIISAQNLPEGGAEFRVWLPAANNQNVDTQ
ncbi:sensor histidine kinase [Sulfitobacter donghicola]|uniref:histidine kinase n=1 Tax=Sulfitobacter donghicola DSW-25 = KCTC 12864 = JCM 14565 TaxID=1300350 RepID=A0A073ITB8_9RHOB|nr:HAMP domain-containing sensor histidine kinase [Sulfitobacter donghicola]KEJ88647.1 histidine kinase [Sulfitobacter donghicola DSW-25 = KCTC 12864 = JCM 14565]KIN68415.1 ATP-binding region, ATPase-like:Histidine kinase, HAMP region:Histidine kinase A, N-terminal [Sulfitobacter donghicola DSW-25 = KCTC 12864 = JCM 14565]